MSIETIEQTFSVTAPASVRVINIRGSVDVQPADNDEVTITAVKHLRTGKVERTIIELEQDEDGRVVARTRFDESRMGGRPCKVDYVVRTPETCDLSVDCVSSKMSVQGLTGTFSLKAVSGNIILKDLAGEARVDSVSGDIVGSRLSGPMTLKSVSGDIDLMEAHLSMLHGTSVSGNLLLDGTLGEGPYRLKTISGDARISLSPESGCILDVTSLSGTFKSTLPVKRTRQRCSKLRAEVLGGGPEVTFSSISGNLVVG
jgi:DUF4097 and DUF4098 domain-containing protein YvlB